MISANSSSLIHFTRKMSTLKLILRNGIRYSYAFESFPTGVIHNLICKIPGLTSSLLNYDNGYGIALPMVSFCDIPLTRAQEHANLYGKYGIGIEKEFMVDVYKHFFNPVIYSSSDSLDEAIGFFSSERLKTMERVVSYIKNMTEEEQKYLHKKIEGKSSSETIASLPSILQTDCERHLTESLNISTLLALYKPYKGINAWGKEQVFYDEREWRAFYPNVDGEVYSWFFPCTREEYLKSREELNARFSEWEDGYIAIPPNCFDVISHIIVKNDDQRDLIIDFILKSQKLFGYPIERNSKSKYKIISKISSFEKTENDY